MNVDCSGEPPIRKAILRTLEKASAVHEGLTIEEIAKRTKEEAGLVFAMNDYEVGVAVLVHKDKIVQVSKSDPPRFRIHGSTGVAVPNPRAETHATV